MKTQKKTKKNWIKLPLDFDSEKYKAQGVDISLLTSTLLKTPTERVEDNLAMLSILEEARKPENRRLDA